MSAGCWWQFVCLHDRHASTSCCRLLQDSTSWEGGTCQLPSSIYHLVSTNNYVIHSSHLLAGWQDSSNRMQQCISTNLTSDADIVATSSYFSRFSSQVRQTWSLSMFQARLCLVGVLPMQGLWGSHPQYSRRCSCSPRLCSM